MVLHNKLRVVFDVRREAKRVDYDLPHEQILCENRCFIGNNLRMIETQFTLQITTLGLQL